jgi:membrane dipeptidase
MKTITGVIGIFVLLAACHNTKESLEDKAARIHDKVFTVDTHCDTPMMLFQEGFDPGKKNEMGKVDFVRMKEGGMDAMFFAVFIGQGQRTDEANAKVKMRANEIIDSIYAAVERYPELAEICTSPEDGYNAEKEGKRAIYLGMENGYPIGRDLNLIKGYYNRGIRYVTLCHTSNNDICDSSTDRKGSEYNGLSEFGDSVVLEMNRLGMIVDVSHISDSSFYDVLRITKAPVIASHSCARALCENPRNMNDDMLRKLAENGGVIQMCILSDYVKTPEPYPARDSAFAVLRKKFQNFDEMTDDEKQKVRQEWSDLRKKYPRKLATVADVVDHIDHIVEIAGIDHVGIGTDFDGGGGVEGCNDVSEMGNITLELVKRGYTEDEIEKIWGGNFIRVFREVQEKSGKNS